MSIQSAQTSASDKTEKNLKQIFDAAEDGGQRDQHDRGIDGGHQGAQRGVGQHHPLVVRVFLETQNHQFARYVGQSDILNW